MLLFDADHHAGLRISVGGLVREISAFENTNKNPTIKGFDFFTFRCSYDKIRCRNFQVTFSKSLT